MTGGSSKPIKVYRLWCGRKRYTNWLDGEEVWKIAIEKGLAYRGINGGADGLGPLTWLERGTRRTPRSRVVIEEPIGNVQSL